MIGKAGWRSGGAPRGATSSTYSHDRPVRRVRLTVPFLPTNGKVGAVRRKIVGPVCSFPWLLIGVARNSEASKAPPEGDRQFLSQRSTTAPMTDSADETRDFFVSFNQADRDWATWIAWVL